MNTICKICGQEFKTIGGLHTHLVKGEATNQIDYYEKYFPKTDLFNEKKIPYKNYEDYSSRLFIDKKSEFAYIRSSGFNEQTKEILSKQLKASLAKSNNRFPTYCEWRSSKNIRFDFLIKENLFDSFKELAANMGANFKLKYLPLPTEQIVRKDITILIDTREQKPLFDGQKTTINVGDYTASKENYNGIHVDRKSKADFIGTFTSGLERFEKECEKAKSMGIYLVVLVEECFSDCFRYRPLKFTKQVVTGESAFNGVRKISRKFNNIQFLFVEGREEAKKYINLILNNKNIVENYDIQFLYELGEFK